MGEENGASADARELFRELLRYFPTAVVDDYYQFGRWYKDLIISDTELIIAHRRESGSPEPPPAEEIDCPELPPDNRVYTPSSYSAPAVEPRRPLMAPTAAIASVANRVVKPMPPKTPPTGAATGTYGSSAMTELQKINEMVSKWGLDPSRTKLLLARLTPVKRREVMEEFVAPDDGSAADAFEAFVKERAGPSALPKQSGPMAAKRPLASPGYGGLLDPSKRPRYGSGPSSAGASSVYSRPTPVATSGPKTTPARPVGSVAAKTGKAAPMGKPGDLIKNLLGSL